MIAKLTKRLLTETDKRLLWQFVWNFGFRGIRAVDRFRRRVRQGRYFPAFLFLSITDRCNLQCQGCWVSSDGTARELSVAELDRIICAAKREGCNFFGILGGEPLLHKGLFDLLGRHPNCYFQVFTNGTLLSAETAAEMRRLGNVTPLISIEGRAAVSDERRGGEGVFGSALEALEHCRNNRLITGVATSICRSNIDELVTREFVDELVDRGVHYLWYYIYRPVGPQPCPELALGREEILRLRRFLVEVRGTAPIAIIDAYWDAEGNALCPAAVGISHHIGPGGDIEPCPPIQLAGENIRDAPSLIDTVARSEFLARFRREAAATTRGCILMDAPEKLAEFARREQARDSSGRNTVLDELDAMAPCPGHHLAGEEIPEKHWLYRFAKKHWFFGFGAYG